MSVLIKCFGLLGSFSSKTGCIILPQGLLSFALLKSLGKSLEQSMLIFRDFSSHEGK